MGYIHQQGGDPVKKRLVAFVLLLLLLPGCSNKEAVNNGPTVDTVPTTTGATMPTDPSQQTVPVDPTVPDTKPDNKPEYQETYHNGKPYIPWGVQQSFTLALENGNTVSFLANVPEANTGTLRGGCLWHASTNDLNNYYMIAYVDASVYGIKSADTFFEDMGESFYNDFYKKFFPVAKDAVIDLRGSATVLKHGTKMSREVGSVQWISNRALHEESFVTYIFQLSDGNYICTLFQCRKKDWPGTQEAAENLVNTLQWGATDGT